MVNYTPAGSRLSKSAPRATSLFLTMAMVLALIRALIAGWSSLEAREAHNLKVAGSNPAPATPQPIPCPLPAALMCGVSLLMPPTDADPAVRVRTSDF